MTWHVCHVVQTVTTHVVVTVHSIQMSNMISLPLFFLTQDAGATPPLAMWQPTADER